MHRVYILPSTGRQNLGKRDLHRLQDFNTLRPRQDGRHFPVDIFKCIFFNENVWISIKISLKFVPNGPIDNSPALVQIMAWCRPGDKPLSKPMMVSLPTHICVTRPQWVNVISLFTHSDGNWIRLCGRHAWSTLVQVMAWCRQTQMCHITLLGHNELNTKHVCALRI